MLQIKNLDGVACDTEQLIAATRTHDKRRSVSNAGHAAFGCPDALACPGVERRDERLIPWNLPAETFFGRVIRILAGSVDAVASIKGHDQQVAIQNRGGSKPMPAIEQHFAIRPRDGAVEGDCHDAAVPENGINTLSVRAGRGSCIGVLALFAQRNLFEERFVPKNFAGGPVDTQHMAPGSILGRGREKNAVLPDDWRRPGFALDFSFPGDIRSRAPVKRQAGFFRETKAGGPTPAGPILGSSDECYKGKQPTDEPTHNGHV